MVTESLFYINKVFVSENERNSSITLASFTFLYTNNDASMTFISKYFKKSTSNLNPLLHAWCFFVLILAKMLSTSNAGSQSISNFRSSPDNKSTKIHRRGH